MQPLGQIFRRHNIKPHCYADAMQLYVPIKSDVFCIMTCLADIKNCMSKDFLHLNDSKLEILIITPSGPNTAIINSLSSSLGAFSNNVKGEVNNLGANFDFCSGVIPFMVILVRNVLNSVTNNMILMICTKYCSFCHDTFSISLSKNELVLMMQLNYRSHKNLEMPLKYKMYELMYCQT